VKEDSVTTRYRGDNVIIILSAGVSCQFYIKVSRGTAIKCPNILRRFLRCPFSNHADGNQSPVHSLEVYVPGHEYFLVKSWAVPQILGCPIW